MPATYELGRPGYPAEIADLIAAQVPAGGLIADVGAGTGKLTRLLAKRRRVVAVEPVAGMIEVLAGTSPTAPAVMGTAEHLPFGADTFHAITVGQAFHWFNGRAALDEFGRVLLPGGRLFLVWNDRRHREPPHPQINAVLAPYRAGAPSYRSGAWRTAFSGDGPFGELGFERIAWTRTVDLDTFVARYLSVSVIASTIETEQAQLRQRLEAIFREMAQGQPTIDVPYETHVFQTALDAGSA